MERVEKFAFPLMIAASVATLYYFFRKGAGSGVYSQTANNSPVVVENVPNAPLPQVLSLPQQYLANPYSIFNPASSDYVTYNRPYQSNAQGAGNTAPPPATSNNCGCGCGGGGGAPDSGGSMPVSVAAVANGTAPPAISSGYVGGAASACVFTGSLYHDPITGANLPIGDWCGKSVPPVTYN